ncbi:unnamed protein product [Parnassius apollo]|uniref:(apollo) hypothetical protein n=1 Tax=Parnassius apollo TaxID=110799 RepID=A0A8S3XX42_PARAO|nr:unnamed protein product [Parnassius apollo]
MDEKNKLEFKEYTRCAADKSSVWQHFLRTSDGLHAQCKMCKKVFKTSGTTSSLHNNLRLVHSIQLVKKTSNYSLPSTSQKDMSLDSDVIMTPATKKAKTINDFFHVKEEDDLDTILAKMTAVDGVPFKIFCSSESMRKLFGKAAYKDLPKSPNTIKKKVLNKSELLKKEVKKELNDIKTAGKKLAISLDEWTSARNRRYVNCAVLDVLYKADNTEGNTGITVNRPCDSSDSEDESDIENEDKNRFVTEADPSGVIPKLVYKELITKVRKIVKFLKGSPTRMDILNSYLESKSKDTTLILDCKTRWSSLADMIARFLEFKDAIQKTLIDLKEKTTFSDTEILILKDMSSSLNFIKAIVEELCERKSNLLIAEIALQFMMEKLAMNPDVISGQLKEALNRRILQRRNATLESHAEIIALIVKINETYFCKDKAATTVFEAEDGLPLREIQRQQRLEDEREQETAKTFKEQLKTKVNESLHNTAEVSTKHLSENDDLETHVIIPESVLIELHGFADSSMTAYGAAMYLRSIDANGNVLVRLLCAQTRIARDETIPRLELRAAHLLANLMHKVRHVLDLQSSKMFLWSDSNIVLAWIKTNTPSKLIPLVKNRVIEIINYTKSDDWHWVPSADNPADLLSRGVPAAKLTQTTMW